MESDDGFESFSEAIKSEPFLVLLAKWRQDVFIRKLKKLPDVVDVIPSGSLARGTHIGSVHDVDLIVVFDPSMHPDYGIKGRSKEATDSAQAAITHLENGLLEQLHPWRGAAGGLLKETEQRTHVVTYGGDWAGPFKDIIPSAPPVDVLANSSLISAVSAPSAPSPHPVSAARISLKRPDRPQRFPGPRRQPPFPAVTTLTESRLTEVDAHPVDL